jgi:Na+-transporting methylmalonyl-CoA/oxaloacetate decarboxylase gamma subunit
MLDTLIAGSDFSKGLVVTLAGMTGVFFVLIVFYLTIRIFSKISPYKPEENNDQQ